MPSSGIGPVKMTGKMSGLLTRAEGRRDPVEWIADDTRPEIPPPSRLRDSRWYSQHEPQVPAFDPWPQQGRLVKVWSEKSVGGTLAPVLEELLVDFRVHHGHTSTTVIDETALKAQASGRHLNIIWVGDHDASGLHMQHDIRRRLQEHGLDAAMFNVERVAITRQDVDTLKKFW